jgi:hypothetical protein
MGKIASGGSGAARSYPEADFAASLVTATCDIYGIRRSTPRHVDTFSSKTMPRSMADLDAKYVGRQAALEKEFQRLTLFFTANKWGGGSGNDWTGQNSTTYGSKQIQKWDQSGSLPVENVEELKAFVAKLNGGFWPNAMIMGRKVKRALQSNADIKRFGGGDPGKVVVNDAYLKDIFELQKFGVIRAVENTGSDATPTMGFMVTEDAIWLGYVPENPAIDEPAACYEFVPEDLVVGAQEGGFVERWFSDKEKTENTDLTLAFKPTMTSSKSGVLVTGLVA